MLGLNYFTDALFFVWAFAAVLAYHLLQRLFQRVSQDLIRARLASIAVVSIGLLGLTYEGAAKVVAFAGIQYLWFLAATYLRRRGVPVLILVIPALATMVLGKLHLVSAPVGSILGLSFLTFRAVQIIVDCEEPVGPLPYFGFLTFFPTLLMGPIAKFDDFKNSLAAVANGGWIAENLISGQRLFWSGVAHKFVVAELIARHGLASISSGSLPRWLDPLAYSAYLYFDFAGYSLIALGLAMMMGIVLVGNFDQPWQSSSPQDFWKRWHISLSNWLRDYVFRPTYRALRTTKWGRANPLLIQNFALFLTLFTMGIWNGLAPHYILSGTLFGVFSVVHNTIINYRKGLPPLAPAALVVGRIATLASAVLALWVFSGRPVYPLLANSELQTQVRFHPVLDGGEKYAITVDASDILFTRQAGDWLWGHTVTGQTVIAENQEFAIVRGIEYAIVPADYAAMLTTFEGQTWTRMEPGCPVLLTVEVNDFRPPYGRGLSATLVAPEIQKYDIRVTHEHNGTISDLSTTHKLQIERGHLDLHGNQKRGATERNLPQGRHKITWTLLDRAQSIYCSQSKHVDIVYEAQDGVSHEP